MTIIKYLVILAAVYSASTHLPPLWKRYSLKREVTKNGGTLKILGRPITCDRKKYCITVYVSPSNIESRKMDITFLAFNKFLPRLRPEAGFGVVIGSANLGEMQSFREQIRDIPAYVDETGLAVEAHFIKTYPTWIVSNQSGDEIIRMTLPVSASTLGQVNQILVSQFKL